MTVDPREIPMTDGWNVEIFGPERPACRHDFREIVRQRDEAVARAECAETALRAVVESYDANAATNKADFMTEWQKDALANARAAVQEATDDR